MTKTNLVYEEHGHEDKARDSSNGKIERNTDGKDDDGTSNPEGVVGKQCLNNLIYIDDKLVAGLFTLICLPNSKFCSWPKISEIRLRASFLSAAEASLITSPSVLTILVVRFCYLFNQDLNSMWSAVTIVQLFC